MFLTNLTKLLEVFDRVYVSSDSVQILEIAERAGGTAILRPTNLCGDTPDIPVYQHALEYMDRNNGFPKVDGIVAVHVDTPTIEKSLIVIAKKLLEMGVQEVMTSHKMSPAKMYKDQANRVFGSIRAMSRNRLLNYPDAYLPDPDVLLVDTSREIETPTDYEDLLKYDS